MKRVGTILYLRVQLVLQNFVMDHLKTAQIKPRTIVVPTVEDYIDLLNELLLIDLGDWSGDYDNVKSVVLEISTWIYVYVYMF